MAETKQKVMEMVREKLKKNPDISTDELFDEAKKLDASTKELTLRQFHARYPLQVKRKMSAGKRKKSGRRRSRRKKEVDRAAIREELLGFAKDLSAAEGTAGVIDVVTNIDDYVERIAKVLDGGR